MILLALILIICFLLKKILKFSIDLFCRMVLPTILMFVIYFALYNYTFLSEYLPNIFVIEECIHKFLKELF